MFGGLNVKSSKGSSGNTDDTSSASKQSATSAFSFLNASTTAPVSVPAPESVSESSPSNNRTSTSDEGSGGVAHEQQQQRQNESSAFTFLNSSTKTEAAVGSAAIPSSSSFSFMNGAVGEDDAPAAVVVVEPSKTSEKSGGIGNGLFDQLNINTAPSMTTATTSMTINSSTLSNSDVSQPSMSLNSIPQSSVKIKPASSTKSSGVTRKKKRSVKIGVAASNADEGGSAVKANDAASASSTKSEDALEQSMKEDMDDVVQRAEAAAKLAMQIEEDTSDNSGSFFKNAFWGKGKKQVNTSSPKPTAKIDNLEESLPSPNLSKDESTESVQPLSTKEVSVDKNINENENQWIKNEVENDVGEVLKSVETSEVGEGVNQLSTTTNEGHLVHESNLPPPPPSLQADPEPISPISTQNLVDSLSNQSNDSSSTKIEMLRSLQSRMAYNLQNSTKGLHSNLASLSSHQDNREKYQNDKIMIGNKLESLKVQIEESVTREEYETAEYMNEEVVLLESKQSELKEICSAEEEKIQTCRVWHGEYTNNVRLLFEEYQKAVEKMSNPDEEKNCDLNALRDEKIRLDTNLMELKADEVSLQKERDEFDKLVEENTRVFVEENKAFKRELNLVHDEIKELEDQLIKKRSEAKSFEDKIKRNLVNIDKERGKHEFRFKKLASLEKSLKSTKAEYETVVASIVEKLSDAEDFEKKLNDEEAMLSDVLSKMLPKLLDYNCSNVNLSDGGEKSRPINDEVSKTKAKYSEACSILESSRMDLQSAESSMQYTAEKMSDIESKVPGLEEAKIKAAAERNFKLAAGLNKQIKEWKIEIEALSREKLGHEDRVDKLRSEIKSQEDGIVVVEESLQSMELALLRSKMEGVKSRIILCENYMKDGCKKYENEMVTCLLSSCEEYWIKIGKIFSKRCNIDWESYMKENSNSVEEAMDNDESNSVNESVVDDGNQFDAEWLERVMEIRGDNEALATFCTDIEDEKENKEKLLESAIEVEDYDEAALLDEDIKILQLKLDYLTTWKSQPGDEVSACSKIEDTACNGDISKTEESCTGDDVAENTRANAIDNESLSINESLGEVETDCVDNCNSYEINERSSESNTCEE